MKLTPEDLGRAPKGVDPEEKRRITLALDKTEGYMVSCATEHHTEDTIVYVEAAADAVKVITSVPHPSQAAFIADSLKRGQVPAMQPNQTDPALNSAPAADDSKLADRIEMLEQALRNIADAVEFEVRRGEDLFSDRSLGLLTAKAQDLFNTRNARPAPQAASGTSGDHDASCMQVTDVERDYIKKDVVSRDYVPRTETAKWMNRLRELVGALDKATDRGQKQYTPLRRNAGPTGLLFKSEDVPALEEAENALKKFANLPVADDEE